MYTWKEIQKIKLSGGKPNIQIEKFTHVNKDREKNSQMDRKKNGYTERKKERKKE